jgi:hypothetical protein
VEHLRGTRPSLDIVARPATADKATQAPDFIEEVVSRQYQAIKFSRRDPGTEEPLLIRLRNLRQQIHEKRASIQRAKRHWATVIARDPIQAKRIADFIENTTHGLSVVESEFWELNVADPDERARQRSRDSFEYQRRVQEESRALPHCKVSGSRASEPHSGSIQSLCDRPLSGLSSNTGNAVTGESSRKERKRAHSRVLRRSVPTLAVEPSSQPCEKVQVSSSSSLCRFLWIFQVGKILLECL